jgi:hypothetical protein
MGGGGGMNNPPPTSPPYTNPPSGGNTPPATSHTYSTGSSSYSTQPPVNRSPATNAPYRNPAPRAQPAYVPPVAAAPGAVDFVTTPAAIPPAPAIALSGETPVVGAGVVAKGGAPPPATPADSGAGTVLWGFGIGAGALGLGVGMRTLWNPVRQLDVGLEVAYLRTERGFTP